jgi:hypothetical protein
MTRFIVAGGISAALTVGALSGYVTFMGTRAEGMHISEEEIISDNATAQLLEISGTDIKSLAHDIHATELRDIEKELSEMEDIFKKSYVDTGRN